MQSTLRVQLEQAEDNTISARWSLSGAAGGVLHEGSIDYFRQWLQQNGQSRTAVTGTTLLLSGDQVVCHTLAFAANEKKHLQKLLPFMLEPQFAVELSRVHVAFNIVSLPDSNEKSQVALTASTDKKQLAWRISELESLGLEVGEIYSIPALLPADDAHWSVLPDGEMCHLNFGPRACTSVESDLLPLVLECALRETQSRTPLQTLTVFVPHTSGQSADADSRAVSAVLEHIKTSLSANNVTAQLRQIPVADLLAGLKPAGAHSVNLRQGEFAAPLRVARYWRQWRVPAIAALLAMTAVLVSTIIEIRVNQVRIAALESRIEQRYRDVMPDGVLVDAVQQLSTQITQRRSSAASQSLLAMLDAMVEPVASAGDLSLHRVSYNSTAASGNNVAEVQLTVSAPDTGSILQFSETMTASGWNTQARNINRVGDRQHASLIVRGN